MPRKEFKISPRNDGQHTRALILETAARLATIEGLEGLSIGRLANELEMSKSGVYAHFRSKEELQLATIATAQETFDREVVDPALEYPTAADRLTQLCEFFLSYLERQVFPGGCFFVTVAAEFDARTGPVREDVATIQREWMLFLEQLVENAQEEGTFQPSLDPALVAFELNAYLEAADLLYLLLDDPQLFDRTRQAIANCLDRSKIPDR